jgi:hypothetical protein
MHRVVGGRRLPVEQGVVYHANIVLVSRFGMHSEVHLLHVQGLCNMSTQLGGACRVLLDHVYTPGEAHR